MKIDLSALGVIVAIVAVIASTVWSAATIATEVRNLTAAINETKTRHEHDFDWLFEYVIGTHE